MPMQIDPSQAMFMNNAAYLPPQPQVNMAFGTPGYDNDGMLPPQPQVRPFQETPMDDTHDVFHQMVSLQEFHDESEIVDKSAKLKFMEAKEQQVLGGMSAGYRQGGRLMSFGNASGQGA
jgi:hypothetical protein